MEHALFTNDDAVIPSAITDANGAVVLACCKVCGLAEIELDEVPECPGVRWPKPPTGQEFVDDWNRTIAAVALFAAKYDLPKPDLIFHPRWHTVLNAASGETLLSVLIARGVRARFGRWEQRDTLI